MAARRAKLVCTIGPATGERTAELVAAGMDVARLNFSHGAPETLATWASAVRHAASAARRSVAILADLPGPKLRVGDVREGRVEIPTDGRFALRVGRGTGDAGGAWVAYDALGRDVRPGDRVLLADGAVELRVRTAARDVVETDVVRGGAIRSRAGLSIPSERLSTPAMTEGDLVALPHAVGLGADYLAQSFVRRAADVEALRERLGRGGPPIVAKIETRSAIDDFDAILGVVDAVMIARGDLGVELPFEEVPIVQKQLVRRALDRGVPTIVATQMLESMVTSARPTRAEASDVANAIFDGADAIMLSAETAIGAHPVLAAEAAARIARVCEDRGRKYLARGAAFPPGSDAGAMALAAVAVAAADASVVAIACYTRTGRTARLLSALRPGVPIHAFSDEPHTVNRLALVHGIAPAGCPAPAASGSRLEWLARIVERASVVPPGSVVALVASSADPGTGPNLLELHRLP